MKILNLHGYHALAENSSYYALKACGYDVISPQIDYDKESPRNLIIKLTELYQSEHCEAVVGSSMGGFFAIQIAAEKQCRSVLINPCLAPFQTLPEMDFDNREYILQYIGLFSNLSKLDFSKTFAIIGEKDDVIKTHGMIKYLLEDSHYISVPDGGHAGSTLPLKQIFEDNHTLFFRS